MSRTYQQAAHAMQTGVAADIEHHGEAAAGASPKQLRVGVNSAMVTDAALARLLIARELFTEEEYAAAVTEEMNREADRYQAELSRRLGAPVTLI